jgi:phosphoglucomutase
MADHWATYGRNYYSRHDFEAVDSEAANQVMDQIRAQLPTLPGQVFSGLTIEKCDEFSYTDPVDGATESGQGLRIWFEGGARAVFRLSGTGTAGATIRLYLERLETATDALNRDAQEALGPVISAAMSLSKLAELTGRTAPDVVT